MELRSTTGRRRRTTIQRLRRGTCSSPRTSTRPRPAARSHRARPPRSSTTVGYARAGWVAPATGTCTTTSASPSTPRPAWRPSSTATISPGTSGGTTTPPSRPKPQVPRSARAPEPAADYRAPEAWGSTSGAPVVEPLSTLLAQLPPSDLVTQDLGGLEAAVVERLEQILRNRKPHVQPDQVGELERAHGVVVAELHRLVDVLGGRDAFLEHGGRELGLRAQAARGRIAILLGELAASHRDRQQVVQSPHGEPQRVRLAVGEADVEAGERGGVGDPVPHGTRADHRDAAGRHPRQGPPARRPTPGTLVHQPPPRSASSRRMAS